MKVTTNQLYLQQKSKIVVCHKQAGRTNCVQFMAVPKKRVTLNSTIVGCALL